MYIIDIELKLQNLDRESLNTIKNNLDLIENNIPEYFDECGMRSLRDMIKGLIRRSKRDVDLNLQPSVNQV